MRIRCADRTIFEARVRAEPLEDAVRHDYYAQVAQIRLSRDPSDARAQSAADTEIIVDGSDVARLVESAVRHPNANMRNAVAAAVWNHPEAFRQVFEFGLNAPEAFREIREIVAEALAKRAARSEAAATTAATPLLPRLPLPPHVRDRGGR